MIVSSDIDHAVLLSEEKSWFEIIVSCDIDHVVLLWDGEEKVMTGISITNDIDHDIFRIA